MVNCSLEAGLQALAAITIRHFSYLKLCEHMAHLGDPILASLYAVSNACFPVVVQHAYQRYSLSFPSNLPSVFKLGNSNTTPTARKGIDVVGLTRRTFGTSGAG